MTSQADVTAERRRWSRHLEAYGGRKKRDFLGWDPACGIPRKVGCDDLTPIFGKLALIAPIVAADTSGTGWASHRAYRGRGAFPENFVPGGTMERMEQREERLPGRAAAERLRALGVWALLAIASSNPGPVGAEPRWSGARQNGGVEAAEPAEGLIQPVLPPVLSEPREIRAADDEVQPAEDPRLPFQRHLPDELLPQPVTPEAERQRQRMIPQIVDPQQELNLLVGHPRILVFAEWATEPELRLYLPDENIARWDIVSETEIAIVGLQPGTTVLTIWFNDPTTETGKRIMSFRLRVFEDPQYRETLDDLEFQINELFPDSYVQLSIIRDRLAVRGQAKDAIEAGQILTILAQTRGRRALRPGDAAARETVTNLFIDQDRFELEDLAATRRSVMDSAAIARAGIINLLEIPGEQQVTLRVIVAEVNRSALRRIGADMEIRGSRNVSFVSLLLPEAFEASTGGNLSVERSDYRFALNALRDMGFARTLAEPNVVALNGETATFFAGNRVPIPQATAGFGAVGQGVAFEQVGVRLNFTPHITDRDRVRLRIAGSVSTLDRSTQTNIGGSTVAAQDARTFETTVELRNHQTLALAGLLQTTVAGDGKRVPLLGDLPLVGTLFSNKGSSASEQELVVLVTPELAHPLDPGFQPPLPGSDVHEPTDAEFFLGNRLESRRGQDFRSPVRTDGARIRQFQKHGHDQYILGAGRDETRWYPATADGDPRRHAPPASYRLRDGF